MSELVCIQQIFCPTRDMYESTKDSTISFVKYLEAHGDKYKNIDLVFGGSGKPEYLNKILALYKKYFTGRCKFFSFADNFGKAYIVNHMAKQYLEQHPECKYIFTFDSDIVFDSCKTNLNMFDILKADIPYVENITKKPFGIIALNMKGDNAHWLHKFDRREHFNTETISWPSNGVGVAGGCLFINVDLWKKINGYQAIGVYAPDDAILMRDTLNAGHGICVLETSHIIHPGTLDDKEYQNWKVQTSQIRRTYEDAVKYCNDFWNMRREREVINKVKDVSYIVLYKEEFKERKDNLIMLLNMLENYFGSNLEIQIIEQDTEPKLVLPFNRPNIRHTFLYNAKPFNRSWAFNVAARLTDKSIYAFADTDIVMKRDQLVHSIMECDFYDVVNPFKNGMWDIVDMNIVNHFNNIRAVDDNISGVNARGVGPTAGLVFFKKEAFYNVGGWDEGFEGWGAEDDALGYKIQQKNISMIELAYNCFHLPHPRHGPHDNPCYQKNCDLLGKISHMSVNDLNVYIASQVDIIGDKHKYEI